MKLPLACAVLSCCFFLLAAASSSPAADASSSKPASSSAETSSSAKPKRDAGLSFGGISSYHGPSHKYLPPAYESHLNLGSFHGSSAGYSDYPSHFKGESSYGHHFAHGHLEATATPVPVAMEGPIITAVVEFLKSKPTSFKQVAARVPVTTTMVRDMDMESVTGSVMESVTA